MKQNINIINNLHVNFFFKWLLQPIQGPGLLFSSVIIFHRRWDSLGEWTARRKAT
jgi:hypothetical protein